MNVICRPVNDRGRRSGQCRPRHPKIVRTLFFACGVFVVLPFFDIPFIGLSATAPLMAPLFYYALLEPSFPWLSKYRGWVLLTGFIWLGILLSFVANGPWLEPRTMQYLEFASLFRYAYWLLVFLVTAWIASDLPVLRHLSILLAVAVVGLAGLRCFEALAFGKVGAWTNPVFTTQNSYGALFSTFTPFLFPFFIQRGWTPKVLASAGLLFVLIACAANGSRGSWVCIGLGMVLFYFLVVVSKPGASLLLLVPTGLCAAGLAGVFVASPSIRETAVNRFSTFDNLEKDKSFMMRQVMNQRSLKLFQEHPVFGVGFGRYREVYVPLEMPAIFATRDDRTLTGKSAHNSYLSFLAEGGTVSFLPLALLLGTLAFRGCLAAVSLNRRREYWAGAVYSSFVAMSVHFWALSGLTGTHGWFVYGLVVALTCVARPPPKGSGFQVRRPASSAMALRAIRPLRIPAQRCPF